MDINEQTNMNICLACSETINGDRSSEVYLKINKRSRSSSGRWWPSSRTTGRKCARTGGTSRRGSSRRSNNIKPGDISIKHGLVWSKLNLRAEQSTEMMEMVLERNNVGTEAKVIMLT